MNPAEPAARRRRPGVAEAVVCWAAWVILTVVAAATVFASIFVLGFTPDSPGQKAAADRMFLWMFLTVVLCLIVPVCMGIGHWRRWHIWYWPAVYAGSLGWTVFLQHSL